MEDKPKFSLAKDRYIALKKRSFEHHVRLFVFTRLASKGMSAELSEAQFKEFLMIIFTNADLRQRVFESYHQYSQLFPEDVLSKHIQNRNKKVVLENITDITAEAVRKKIVDFSKSVEKGKNAFSVFFHQDFEEKVTLKMIEDLYGDDAKDRKCDYCEISESQIEQLGCKLTISD